MARRDEKSAAAHRRVRAAWSHQRQDDATHEVYGVFNKRGNAGNRATAVVAADENFTLPRRLLNLMPVASAYRRRRPPGPYSSPGFRQ